MLDLLSRRLLFRATLGAMAACGCGWLDRAGAQTISEFPLPIAHSNPEGIAAGPDGALWFAENGTGIIGRITVQGTVTEFPLPSRFGGPYNLVAGPDGALWITELANNKIAHMTISGAVTEFTVPGDPGWLAGITVGPDGALWFTENQAGMIGRITTQGSLTEFPLPSRLSYPQRITVGPDGALWFTEFGANKIGRITTGGTITEFAVSGNDPAPYGIALGSDGALWFTEYNANNIVRLTVAGVMTEFAIATTGGSSSVPFDIVSGPDGALWFTVQHASKIGRITTAGSIMEFDTPTPASTPWDIAVGPDGALWFTEYLTGKVGRVTVSSSAPSLVAATLPSSRSVQVGNPATAFASIINTGAAATGCAIMPISSVPATFGFRPTDPATNQVTGSLNTPVNIAAGALQTFVVGFAASGPMVPTNVLLGFGCDNVLPVSPIVGVNTLLLTFDANPVPDVIAVGLTPSNDGFAHTGGNGGTGLFVIASDNIGLSASLTARARLSNPSLPITATVCQTNPQTAACLATPSASVTATINNNQTSTWAAFLTASGAVNPDPAANRVFFEFVDSGGIVRGSTSTAVTTQ
jgi:streptogramin lyase